MLIKVLLCHGGFWGPALTEWWEDWSWDPQVFSLGPFGGRKPSANKERLILLRECWGPVLSPWLLCQQWVLVTAPRGAGSFYMPTEILPVLCPQQPVPGAVRWEAEDVGRQRDSLGKPDCYFCFFSPGHSRSLGTGFLTPCDKLFFPDQAPQRCS